MTIDSRLGEKQVDQVAGSIEKVSIAEDGKDGGLASSVVQETNEGLTGAEASSTTGEKRESDEVVVTLNSKSQIYSSISSFEELGLRKELLDGVYALGYQKPSKIQEKALPLLLANPPVNMIGQSQAGINLDNRRNGKDCLFFFKYSLKS